MALHRRVGGLLKDYVGRDQGVSSQDGSNKDHFRTSCYPNEHAMGEMSPDSAVAIASCPRLTLFLFREAPMRLRTRTSQSASMIGGVRVSVFQIERRTGDRAWASFRKPQAFTVSVSFARGNRTHAYLLVSASVSTASDPFSGSTASFRRFPRFPARAPRAEEALIRESVSARVGRWRHCRPPHRFRRCPRRRPRCRY